MRIHRLIICIFELTVLVLTSMATLLYVPQQKDIIQMVIGCTSLIMIINIDEQVYKCVVLKCDLIDKKYFLEATKSFTNDNMNRIRNNFVLLIVVTAVSFVLIAHYFDVNFKGDK